MTVGDFFAEHRKLIDARKAHLARVGITAPDAAPAEGVRAAPATVMPSQADVLAMPTTNETPLIEATHAPLAPAKPTSEYQQPKLPLGEE